MNTCMVGTAECLGEQIEYYLLTEVSEEGTEVYGIQVQLGTEQIAIHDLSVHSDEVRELLEKMVAGSVTPVTVPDVVNDWLLC